MIALQHCAIILTVILEYLNITGIDTHMIMWRLNISFNHVVKWVVQLELYSYTSSCHSQVRLSVTPRWGWVSLPVEVECHSQVRLSVTPRWGWVSLPGEVGCHSQVRLKVRLSVTPRWGWLLCTPHVSQGLSIYRSKSQLIIAVFDSKYLPSHGSPWDSWSKIYVHFTGSSTQA